MSADATPKISLSDSELAAMAAIFDDFLEIDADGEAFVPPERNPELAERVAHQLSRCELEVAAAWFQVIQSGEFKTFFADICRAAAPLTKVVALKLAMVEPAGNA